MVLQTPRTTPSSATAVDLATSADDAHAVTVAAE